MRDVMVDLETVGNTPGSAILSIGAVAFDPVTGEIDDGHYSVVNLVSCMVAGLHADESTLEWWRGQAEDAKAVLREATSTNTSVPLRTALLNLNDYLRRVGGDKVQVWGNGSDFDNAFLSAAYRGAGLPTGWKFWNNRCFRTLKNLFPDVPAPERVGTFHNAKDDATTQAIHACRIFQHMRNLGSLAEGTKAAVPQSEIDALI